MKLLVPYVGELHPADVRLIRLAEFLGIEARPIVLRNSHGQAATYLERVIPDRVACLVVNPRVMQAWLGIPSMPAGLASYLVSRFSHLLVHSPRPESFDASVISALSEGKLEGTQPVERAADYEISPDSKDVCGSFAGLRFGPADPACDRVFRASDGASVVRQFICIAGQPLMAAMSRNTNQTWFLGCPDVADLHAELGDTPMPDYFSRLLPPAMALRAIFGEGNWQPGEGHASVIIDDPLLRRNYGFLNFESLLGLTRRHNFHTTIAFIPHNFRRSASQITRLFRENPERLGICFHGNDHTGAEFASTDMARLNTMLRIAEQRMKVHQDITGLQCDRVMVFPQGNFSLEAMTALRSHNFDGAVNTVPHPRQDVTRLTLGELAQPAVLRYGSFPLFLRKESVSLQAVDVAFNLFFGKPVLIVEHHDVCRRPEILSEVAARINSVAPDIRWSNLTAAMRNAFLRKRTADNIHHVLAYSNAVCLANDTSSSKRYLVEWPFTDQNVPVEQVVQDGNAINTYTVDATAVRLSVDLPAHSSQTFSLVHQNLRQSLASLGLGHKARAFLRRRLSEVRDNYLSRTPHVLAAARTLQRRLSFE